MIQKTFNPSLAKYLIYNVLCITTSLLSPSYRHIVANTHFILRSLTSSTFFTLGIAYASMTLLSLNQKVHYYILSFSPRSVILVSKERHVGRHRASPCWARSVSARCKERLVAGRNTFSDFFWATKLEYIYYKYVCLCVLTPLRRYAVTLLLLLFCLSGLCRSTSKSKTIISSLFYITINLYYIYNIKITYSLKVTTQFHQM